MWTLDVQIKEPSKHALPTVLREIADTMEERSNQLSEGRTEDDGARRYWKIEEEEEEKTDGSNH